MKKNGYATALIGKWHLGYKPEFSPRAHGFDLFFGYKSAAIDYYTHFTTRPGEGAEFAEAQPDLWDGDTLIEQDGYMTDLITRRSVEFINQNNAARPYFIDKGAHMRGQVVPRARAAAPREGIEALERGDAAADVARRVPALDKPADIPFDRRTEPQRSNAIDRLGTNEDGLQHGQSPLCPVGEAEILCGVTALCVRISQGDVEERRAIGPTGT